MSRRYALRDDPWERIKNLLPGRVDTVGVTAKDNHPHKEHRVMSPTHLTPSLQSLWCLLSLLMLLIGSSVVGTTHAQIITYIHNDIAGTPMAATDASGNLLWNRELPALRRTAVKPRQCHPQSVMV